MLYNRPRYLYSDRENIVETDLEDGLVLEGKRKKHIVGLEIFLFLPKFTRLGSYLK